MKEGSQGFCDESVLGIVLKSLTKVGGEKISKIA